MSDCETLQDRALEDGARGVTETPELREHLAQCTECQRFLEDLETLTGALQALPLVDAPNDLVERTARQLRSTQAPPVKPARRWGRARYWYSAAASILVMGFAVLLLQQPQHRQLSTAPESELSRVLPEGQSVDRLQSPEPATEFAAREATGKKNAELVAQLRESERLLGELSELPADAGSGTVSIAGRLLQGTDTFEGGDDDGLVRKRRANRMLLEGNEQKRDARTAQGFPGARALPEELRDYEFRAEKERTVRRDGDRSAGLATLPASPPPAVDEAQEEYRKSETSSFSSTAENLAPAESPAPSKRPHAKDNKGYSEADQLESAQQAAAPVVRDLTFAGAAGDSPSDGSERQGRASARAEQFLTDLERVEGLRFKAAEGYWRNTYVPGDSAMRLLRTRLGLWHKVPGIGDVRLEQAVRANRQPLDVPDNAAMGLYLQADKAAVSGVGRVRLQVGLQGAVRQGARPTMNLSVLLDLSNNAQQPSPQQVRAIVDALLGAHQPGDRFSLTVTGADGGLLVDAADFRHGPLQVALARLFSGEMPAGAQPVSLIDALQIATVAARSGDDPSAVFGSSLVLLITAGIDDAQLPTLQTIAHRNAVGGIALSVVDTGAGGALGTGSPALERLVAAGQGQRRAMAQPDDAARVINAELHAASRAVARAARLRIRLGPGVQLIDVLGSERLEEPQAERVREAERSIDQRLARNIGIRADRGEDEDGIQIVIPNFHAGDSHVILLDLLVDGPGTAADVTLRYKDLVHLKNGVARAELKLPGGDRRPGPLQRNVLKNRVAFELAQAARDASRLLEQGDAPRAIETLRAMHELLAGLRETVNGWSSDRELLADARVLADYVAYLQANLQTHPFHQRYLVESLRYMAFRKLTAANGEPQP